MTAAPPRDVPRPRAFELAAREQPRACAEHRFASPRVTPLERPIDVVGPERPRRDGADTSSSRLTP